MDNDTPETLLESFFTAFNRRDLETLMALYEPRATLVAEPARAAEGAPAVRQALQAFLALQPRMKREGSRIVVAGDVALALTRWTLEGTAPDGNAIAMHGEATDVFRQQPDGRWLVVLDNPWGASLLSAGGAS